MLKKLLKYDMRSIGRLMLPLTVCVIVSSILCTISIRFIKIISDNPDAKLLSIIITVTGSIFIFLSVAAIAAYSIVTLFLIMSQFYRNLFTDEGYLTFTLPVSTDTLLLSKLLSSSVWSLISVIVTFMSCFIIIFFGMSSGGLFNIELWEHVTVLISTYINNIGVLSIFSYAVYVVIAGLYLILMFFLSITIGAIIAKRHRIIAAIGIYYLINMAVSIISGAFNVLINYIFSGVLDQYHTYTEISSFVSIIPMMNSFLYLGFSAAAYIICRHMLKNKLNLQ